MDSDLPAPSSEPSTDGRCFVYILPSAWEDHCKIGFSRDPLSRMQALHPRWFEFFDLDQAMLVEAETIRDARDLELELRRPLVEHNAPAPLTVRARAGGHTEWFRGAGPQLQASVSRMQQRGHRIHAPLRRWARAALLARSDQLFAWAHAQLSPEELAGLVALSAPRRSVLRDTLDAYVAMAIELEPFLSPEVYRWYVREAGHGFAT